jgi:hypothetical protein
MIHSKSVTFEHNTHHVSFRQTVPELRPKIDKSMGIVTRIADAFARILKTYRLYDDFITSE